ncbi:NAD(P)/FAD-dependent oxidoreductase [Jannaschia sp. S6380]|uniref:flavin-containing monooxygenase n=1 Tax=Jannaschia sp. S6380 TaxID=2926408 RepID=UPI001FF2A31D|nr:NAD(P)/FAD-dependent oxidoreductase [Jannaschia sp. S6380]
MSGQVDCDVAIVGAGLSGICAAHHLTRDGARRSVTLFEARDGIGGTWDLFRYPGIRSDSDMATLGYGFRPWTSEKAIADGPAILSYVRDTARDLGLNDKIRFRHRLVAADWQGDVARWRLTFEMGDTGETVTQQVTCRWLYLCTGYYDYARGHRPDIPGLDAFAGPVLHPQHWPEGFDPAGRRIVVVGSGATAVTLVPELARSAAHVTMLQRSPTHIVAMPSTDRVANGLRRVFGERRGHALTRWKNILLTMGFYQASRRAPGMIARLIRRAAARAAGSAVDPDLDLTPAYDPWDQRLCIVPDGDLFHALRDGRAAIVTDRIDAVTARGGRTRSGRDIAADAIVLATGLRLQVAGGATLSRDGVPIDIGRAFAYKGVMYSGVPNLSMALGYINASWTLKCELIARYTRRLLDHMDEGGFDWAVPDAPPPDLPVRPTFELSSGYLERARDRIPRQTDRAPWRMLQNYIVDRRLLGAGTVTDAMTFGRAGAPVQNPERVLSTPPLNA